MSNCKKTPFRKEYDAIICGGGVAGCAAAIACARNGLRTALIENQVVLGGLATSGIVLIYLPLCDGKGNMVIQGLSRTFIERCNDYGPSEINPAWNASGNVAPGRNNRFYAYFSPASFMLTLDEMMEENQVDVWFDTRLTGVKMAPGGNSVKKICIDNKSGHGELSAKVFIDATGDADLVFFAGKELHCAGNAEVIWAIERREKQDSTSYTFGKGVSTLISADDLDDLTIAPGINGKLLSRYMLATRKRYKKELLKSYAGSESRKDRYPLMLPGMAPLRHTRCIIGEYMLEKKDENTFLEDSLGVITDWRKGGVLLEVPLRSFIPKGLKNVLAAGRTLSASGDAWEITRVIPCAAMTGEAAGESAAMFIREKKKDLRLLEVKKLQTLLREKCSFPIHINEIYTEK